MIKSKCKYVPKAISGINDCGSVQEPVSSVLPAIVKTYTMKQ